MARKETGQLAFDIGPDNTLLALTPPDKPVHPEGEYRVGNIITFSALERIVYQELLGVRPRNIFDASLVVGTALDRVLVPANFVYRYRSDYCFPQELYPEWDLITAFARFYPTGWDREEILSLLERYRPNFQTVLYPANSALERRNIKKALIPLWEEIAKQFNLDSLYFQGTMKEENGLLLPSGQTASRETIAQIGQRIMRQRFDTLVDDDKNYTYIAKPDCLLVYELDGEIFHIQVQPDYIKRLRERRKSVKKRQIVTKRIIGDFKDSDKRDLDDFATPFGQVMLAYNWLLLQIGQRFRWNQLCLVRLANRQVRRVFLIPQEVIKPVQTDQVQTALEFLQEKGEQIFSPMPKLSKDAEELARGIFEKALLSSRGVTIS